MKFIITAAIIIGAFFCKAQEQSAVKTFYMKGNSLSTSFPGKRVMSKDSADFIRTVATEKNNENLYDVNEYYLDKGVRRIGNSLTNGITPKYNGNVITYYKNGNKASEELFVSGRLKGISNYYFSNKQLKKTVNYGFDKMKITEVVLALNDSLGTHFLDETGTRSFKISDEKGDLTEGTYTKGLKDKTWKKVDAKNNETYFDEYKDGEYVKGKTVDADGKTIKYDAVETLPSFKGGLPSFGSFLSNNLRYPSDARDNNIQGRVFLQFVVEKGGSLGNIKVVRGIGYGCDEEALRVINKSPKWNPGIQRGKAVRVSYTLPIFFQLNVAKPQTETREPFGG